MYGPKSARDAIAIIGAGTQGRRLAFMWSRRGRPVTIFDMNSKQLKDAISYVNDLRNQHADFKVGAEWGAIYVLESQELKSRLANLNPWLIVECIPEKLPLKKELLQGLGEMLPKETIIASNSSSYTISDIIEGLTLSNPQRMLSMHSYWPPETNPIELMGSDKTDSKIIDVLMKECADHGFRPFHVRKDSVGYLYNRIWAAIKREALLTVSEGIATPQELDAIFKEVLKTPKGPCEQMDVVGLDVVLAIEEHYADTRPGLPEAPRTFLKKMIAENKLGIKTGEGFYKY